MPLETADTKVKEICEILRKETLEPAQNEAKRILAKAEKEADDIIRKAKDEGARLKEETKRELANEFKAHEASIMLAVRQGISALRQSIEKIFLVDLCSEIERVMVKEEVIAEAIRVVFTLLDKEGLGANLQVLVPKQVDVGAICAKLSHNFAERVKKGAVSLDDIKGGARVKCKDKKISIDITDKALQELLASYVIPELRELILGA